MNGNRMALIVLIGCMILLALMLGGCGSVSCPKGRQWGVTSTYWIPTISYPGHEELISIGKLTEEIWVPGYTIYGHWGYVWGCKNE